MFSTTAPSFIFSSVSAWIMQLLLFANIFPICFFEDTIKCKNKTVRSEYYLSSHIYISWLSNCKVNTSKNSNWMLLINRRLLLSERLKYKVQNQAQKILKIYYTFQCNYHKWHRITVMSELQNMEILKQWASNMIHQ